MLYNMYNEIMFNLQLIKLFLQIHAYLQIYMVLEIEYFEFKKI